MVTPLASVADGDRVIVLAQPTRSGMVVLAAGDMARVLIEGEGREVWFYVDELGADPDVALRAQIRQLRRGGT